MAVVNEEIPFSTIVRRFTRKIHKISDDLVNAKFMIAANDPSVWSGGLEVFYHVFAYLEDAVGRLNLSELNELFVDPCMLRKEAFEIDLYYYYGDAWSTRPMSGELATYLEHLDDIEKTNPILLSAYIYHLYLGLLSGGQILAAKRKIKSAAYEDRVTNFGGANLTELKKKMRDSLNTIAAKWSEEERALFLAESRQVFVLNNGIIGSVEGQTGTLLKYFSSFLLAVLVLVAAIVIYRIWLQNNE